MTKLCITKLCITNKYLWLLKYLSQIKYLLLNYLSQLKYVQQLKDVTNYVKTLNNSEKKKI